MNARRLPGFALAALAALTGFAGSAPTLHAASPQRPNVVILLADDLGWKDVGSYGGPVKTPAIDSLAARGMRFTDFYSGAAVCSPSRAVLLTGRHHLRAGVYSWIHDPAQNSHLLEREVTLAEVLKQAGYATAHIGKWHLGLPTPERPFKPTPAAHGFDYWFATWNNAAPSHRNPTNFIRNGEPVGELQGYSAQLVVDEAIGWLRRHRQSGSRAAPFFLNVWFHEPHAPLAAPDTIVREYSDTLTDRAAIYSGTIDNTDRAIARLLKTLAALDAPENTLVVYASDNGSYRDDRVGGLRGRKGSNWEGGIRVPGIFFWPGTIPAGVVSSEPSGLVDLLPTVCGLLKMKTPTGVHLDGSSLAALLRGETKAIVRHQPLFWHLQRSRPIVAMRDGDWSLVADPDYELSDQNTFMEAWIPAIKTGGYANYQLFNLRTDPGQTTDLATREPGRLALMRQQLLAINASVMADAPDWHRHAEP